MKPENEIREKLASVENNRAVVKKEMDRIRVGSYQYRKLELEANLLWAFAQSLRWCLGENITAESLDESLRR